MPSVGASMLFKPPKPLPREGICRWTGLPGFRVTRGAGSPIVARLMNREVLDRGCERGIIGLVLAILVFGPLAADAVRKLELLVILWLPMAVGAFLGVLVL